MRDRHIFIYNHKKDKHDPLKAAKNIEWKLLLPWCLVVPLIRTYYVDRKLRTHQQMNRACLYFLDLPVISPHREEVDRLRVLRQE